VADEYRDGSVGAGMATLPLIQRALAGFAPLWDAASPHVDAGTAALDGDSPAPPHAEAASPEPGAMDEAPPAPRWGPGRCFRFNEPTATRYGGLYECHACGKNWPYRKSVEEVQRHLWRLEDAKARIGGGLLAGAERIFLGGEIADVVAMLKQTPDQWRRTSPSAVPTQRRVRPIAGAKKRVQGTLEP